jgi:hypothetical protein
MFLGDREGSLEWCMMLTCSSCRLIQAALESPFLLSLPFPSLLFSSLPFPFSLSFLSSLSPFLPLFSFLFLSPLPPPPLLPPFLPPPSFFFFFYSTGV